MDASNRVPYIIGEYSPVDESAITPEEWARIIGFVLWSNSIFEYLSGFRPLFEVANDYAEWNTRDPFMFPHVGEECFSEKERSLHVLSPHKSFNDVDVEERKYYAPTTTKKIFLTRKRKFVVWEATWDVTGKHADHGTALTCAVTSLDGDEALAAFFAKHKKVAHDIIVGLFFRLQDTIAQRFHHLETMRAAEHEICSLALRAGIKNLKPSSARIER